MAIVVLLACGALGLAVASCAGGQGGVPSTTTRVSRASTTPATSLLPPSGGGVSFAEQLSAFRSKDPFIQQDVTSTTSAPTTGTTGQPAGPTTTYRPGTTATTRYPTTLPHGGSTTSSTTSTSTTTTTAPHVHVLKILGVSMVGGAPAVTFKVDSSVYQDRRVGDVVSSTWGQIKVLEINTSTKVVTLLHGSETLVLAVGQQVFE